MARSASGSKPRLVVRRGPNPDTVYTLRRAITIVGREPLNDVVVPDPEVSRRHARIFLEGDAFFIEDLGSTNGTYVNGRRIGDKTRLASGDIIDFGETVRVIYEHDIAPTTEGDEGAPFPISDVDSIYETTTSFPGDRATAKPMRPTLIHKMVETDQHLPLSERGGSDSQDRSGQEDNGNPTQMSPRWFVAFGIGFGVVVILGALALYLYIQSTGVGVF